jgi:pyridoxal 5'-phosphate synthase pdxS subunit
MSQNNGSNTSLRLKTGLAEMLKGGVIMDVTNAEQASIAEKAGAVAVMALERVPAQIRAEGGVARMASPKKIREIMATVSIPVMAKCRIGHFAEAQILQELGVDYIDESEVLTPADEAHHVDKHAFNVPFVCGARNLGEALRRIAEGAAMIRTKGEAGTGDVVHAVKHIRQIVQEMKILTVLGEEELYAKAKEHGAPYELIKLVAKTGKLPVPNFSAGGIATPADASLVMQLGAEAVFVGSGIFMSSGRKTEDKREHLSVEAWTRAMNEVPELALSLEKAGIDESLVRETARRAASAGDEDGKKDVLGFASPEEAEKRARAIVKAATHYQDPKVLLEVSEDLQGAMKGLAVAGLDEAQMLQTRGW